MTTPRARARALRGRATGRRAFSLIEMSLSLAITSILMVAIGSAVVMLVRSMPASARAVTAPVPDPALVCDRIAADVAYATSIAAATSRALEVRVPDRDRDATAETIRYEWSGTPGDPLRRVYNGVSDDIIPAVQSLGFTYRTRPLDTVVEGTSTGSSGDLAAGPSTSTNNYVIDASNWWGQYIKPTLPADATAWSITRVRILVFRSLISGGAMNVEIRTADANGLPTNQILATQVAPYSLLGVSLSWFIVDFGEITGLDPTRGICLVVTRNTGIQGGWVGANVGTPTSVDSFAVRTTNGGSTWTTPASTHLIYVIEGRVTRRTSSIQTRNHLDSVSVSLTPTPPAGKPARTATTAIRVATCPEAP